MCPMEYYSSFEEDNLKLFRATWMELEGIVLAEISQKKKRIFGEGLTYMRDLGKTIRQEK